MNRIKAAVLILAAAFLARCGGGGGGGGGNGPSRTGVAGTILVPGAGAGAAAT